MNLKKLYRPLTGMATMLALTLFTSVGSVLAAPTLTTPTMSNVGTNQITLNLTSSDTGTGYFTLLNGSGTACGTGAQVKAGQTSASTAAARFGSLPLVAATTAPYTLRNLFQTTAYTVCFTADDGTNLQATPVTANVATTTMAAIGTPAWGPVGSVGVSTGSASNTSLTFAPDGAPYVVYDELNSGILTVTVKKFTGSAWTQVGSPGINGYFPSLAFAPDGTPYLVVKSNDNGDFQVMKYNGSAWSTLGFLGYGFYSRFDSKCIAFAPDGALYMAYSDASNRDRLTVVKYNGSTWSTVGLASGFSPNIADYISLAFAPDGAPYVAYQASGSCPCGGFVMKFNGSDWIYVGGADGFTAADFPLYTSLAFASDGAPYVAYVGFTLGSVQVVKFTGSEWISVGSAGLSGDAYTSLAFAPDGAPYVAYQSYQDGGKATVIKFIGSDWTTVGSAGFSAGTATYTSLAFAPDGAPYVAYVADATYPAKATVMKLVNASTATTVTSNLNPATVGASVTFTATVTPSAATGTVTFSVDGTAWGTGTLSGGSATYSTAALTAVSHSITAAYGGDSVYLGSTSTALTQSVNKIGQTITFNNPGAQNFGTTPTLAATASSLLTPTFTSTTTGICGITSGGLLAFVTPGTCTIKADQNGNSSYNAAPTVSQSFTVNRATPSVTFGTAPTPTYLSGNFTVSASTTNTDSPSLTYSYVSGPCAFVSGAIFSSSGAGTCVVQASGALTTKFNAASQQQSVTIAKATPTATVSNTPVTYDGNAKTVAVTCLGGGASSAIAPATQTAAGTYAVTATCAGTANYNAATTLAAGNFVINKATPTATVSNTPVTYDGNAKTVAVTCLGGGASSAIAPATQTAAGTYAVTATCAGTANYNAATTLAAGNFVIDKASASATVSNTPVTYDGNAKTVAVTCLGGGASSAISPATQTAAGTYAVTATCAGTANYNAATTLAAGNFVIDKASTSASVSNTPVTYDGNTKTVAVTCLGGGASSAISPATQTAAGTYAVTATCAGTANYNAATTLPAGNFVIDKATTTVALSNLTQTYTGSTLTPTAVTTPPGLTVDWTNAPQTNVGSTTVTATIKNANYQGSQDGTFTINKANPTINIIDPSAKVGGAATVSANGGSGVFTFSTASTTACLISGATVTGLAAGNCSIKADQVESANYNAGTQTQSFAIVKGDQIITFGPAPAVIVAGSGTVSASTTSGLVVTYASTTPATCTLGGVNNATVTGVKAGACTINAAQPGNGNFNAATAPAPQTFTITMANQIITFGAAPIIGVGSTGIVSATGGASGNPVIFSSSSLATICTVTGNTVTGVGAGTCSITANQAGADNYYNAALPITQNVIIAPVSQVSVVIQTIPSGLNFTVTDTAGTNSYTAPHVFTWVPGSSHTVTATSTQPGSTGVRYIFNNWSDSGAMTHTITAPVASATYTAAFATQYQLTTTNTDGHGSAIPVIQWYNAGYNAGVLATPNAGYVFAAWSLTSGTGPITNLATSNTSVTMNGPNTVNAAMQQLAPANLSASIVTAGKSGNVGGIRIWPITIKNTGNSSADTVALKAVTLSTSGACKPTVTTDSLLPLGYGAIAGPGSVTKNIQVNFTKCPALTKFTVTISYSGAGSITGSNTFTGVTQ